MLLMEIAIHPNPFRDFVEIKIEGEEKENSHCIISLNNPQGKILRMMGIKLERGNNHFVIERLNALDSGLYHLNIKTTDGKLIHQSTLQKN